MQSQEIAVGQRSVLNVAMEQEAKRLEDVIVVAYGTTTKERFTGSAEVIKAEKINSKPVSNVTKALDGLVAGVQTTSGSGQPGSGSSVVIRGFGSLGSTSPLYVVDGVPYNGSISAINPNDIESMTILKDASAGALYGARGANGVIMVTTKKGEVGKTRLNFKANWGISSRFLPRYETMDEAGYLETIFQSYKNREILDNGLAPEVARYVALEAMRAGSTAMLGKDEQYNPFNYSITELIDPVTGKVRSDAYLKYHEDWLDEAMANNPLRQEYDLSFSGSTKEGTSYMFSFGYLNEEGLLKTTKFDRYSGRTNVETKVTDWLKGKLNANYSRNESNSAAENSSGSSNIWYAAQLMAPIFPVFEKDADGATVYDNLG
jgi:TonB-dependent SusC/RagA subfamily outer membrane receptor